MHINGQKSGLEGGEETSKAPDLEPEDKGSLRRFLTVAKSFNFGVSVACYVKWGNKYALHISPLVARHN